MTTKLTKINNYNYSLKIKNSNNMAYIIKQCFEQYLNIVYYDDDKEYLYFSAENVSHFVPIQCKYDCFIFLENIVSQIKKIQNLGYGFYAFDKNDILVIDGNFIFCDTKHILPIVETIDSSIFVIKFIKNIPYYASPEITQIHKLPTNIHYNTCYYSLGMILVEILLHEKASRLEYNMDSLLSTIKLTKWFWFLKRCFQNDIKKRTLLLI